MLAFFKWNNQKRNSKNNKHPEFEGLLFFLVVVRNGVMPLFRKRERDIGPKATTARRGRVVGKVKNVSGDCTCVHTKKKVRERESEIRD